MKETPSKKESFIIYKSFYEPISSLSLNDRGLLFTAIFEYQINKKIIDLPASVKMAFMFFKNQFDLDFLKWLDTCEKRSKSGKKGGRPKESKTKQKKQMLSYKAKEAENENENENENVNDKKNITKKEISFENEFEEFWSLYPRKLERKKSEIRFVNILKNKEATFEEIIKGLKNYVEYLEQENTEKCFIKHSLTWLNGACWQNEYEITEEIETPF
jgi:hypothetical protein